MKVFNRDMRQAAGGEVSGSGAQPDSCHPTPGVLAALKPGKGGRHRAGFTLIELLVVISILGILAALAVPALKNIGKSNIALSGSRQLLDDLARARQLAMSQHTTVYMVFVPPNFWINTAYNSSGTYSTWWNNLSAVQKTAATNLCDKQFTGYTFVTLRSVGDQPGRGTPHYLAPWQNLPNGTFIATNKFELPGTVVSSTLQPLFQQWNTDYPHSNKNTILAFTNMVAIPFPTADAANPITLPCLAFNYLGQLTDDGQSLAQYDEYIPLAQGSVSPAIDVGTKTFVIGPPPAAPPAGSPSVVENPPGNSTNTYNIVHVDRLTGRAVLEYQKVQ